MNIKFELDDVPFSVIVMMFDPESIPDALIALNNIFVRQGLTDAQAAQAADEAFNYLRETVLKFAMNITTIAFADQLDRLNLNLASLCESVQEDKSVTDSHHKLKSIAGAL